MAWVTVGRRGLRGVLQGAMLLPSAVLSTALLGCGAATSSPGTGTDAPPAAGSPTPGGSVAPIVPVGGTPSSPSSPSDPAAPSSHCVDLGAASECVESTPWNLPPVALMSASELGDGFSFASLNGDTALAHGASHSKAVVIDRLGTVAVVELIWGAPRAMLDAMTFQRLAERRLLVLACAAGADPRQRSCEVLGSERHPDSGAYEPLSRLVELDSAWEARGLVDLWQNQPDAHQFCVYGRGIHCLDADGAWKVAVSPDEGRIVAVSVDAGWLALTETGALLAARRDAKGSHDAFDWEHVPTSAPLTRLSEAGAFDDLGLWVKRIDAGFEQCNQQPRLLAGNGISDALAGDGTPYSRQGRLPGFCRWPGAMSGSVLGETHLVCGLAMNWVVLTNDAVFSMGGGLYCAYD